MGSLLAWPATWLESLPGWLVLADLGGLYLVLWGRHRRRRPGPALAFLTGLLVLGLTLSPPLAVAAEHLFSLHVAQHLLLGMVGPLLLLLGRPAAILVRGAPRPVARLLLRAVPLPPPVRALVGSPLVGVLGLNGLLFYLHEPAAYDRLPEAPALHALAHGALFLSGLLFWWPALGAGLGRGRFSPELRLGYLFVAGLVTGLSGFFFVFAPTPLIRAHLTTAPAWGLSPLADQQLGGILIVVAAKLVVLGALTIFFFRLMAAADDGPGWRRPSFSPSSRPPFPG